MENGYSIRKLGVDDVQLAVEQLAALLVDCVDGGASVSFMRPLTIAKAHAFWSAIADDVRLGKRHVLVAEGPSANIVGTVQFVPASPENQPHRADVAKLLVHSGHRRKGIASALLKQVEYDAEAAGRTILVLDTVSDSPAEHLYLEAGWKRVGVVPDYALMPDGELCAATFMFKKVNT